MPKELSKQYDPTLVEDRVYKFWEDGGYFSAKVSEKQPYTIVMPPPNITGQLHMGHALDNALQDLLIRFARMQGKEALWLPGTDHASIATEARIVDTLKKEGTTKEDLGREKYLERAWQWKEEFGGRIVGQLRKIGSSCDWGRERFTMDEGCSEAVVEVFNRLYEKGLIYRGERIINWCPKCVTSLSDIEVEHEEQAGHFWRIKYPLKDGGGFVEIATTRPETLLGDTAVAVHPEDERYKHLIGKTLILPLLNREIPIVADEYVDPEFGTGAVKITPAHDPNDFEVGARHGLPLVNVMSEDATINENGGRYKGLGRYEARAKMVEDLTSLGLLAGIKEHTHNVGTCYRCASNVEPWASKQWFVKMQPLAEPAIEVVRDGSIKFVPERFEKIYFNWMENIRDWCISRQIWWGHRIPAWYCGDCGEVTVARQTPDACKCGSKNLRQDSDTLDTWFSSALWPFSTLGWPDENAADLKYFYPTSVLVTGYDIIFFWVARMIFSGVYQMGEVPFSTVFIHGLVRDSQGRKMSKSLGNGVDPLDIIAEYGADALRFTLATGVSPGNDLRFSDEKCRASRNFCNKIWNAARYILMSADPEVRAGQLPETLYIEDKWILSKYNTLVAEVTGNLEKYELGVAASKLYDFFRDVLCDWYIELSKTRIGEGGASALSAQQVLLYVLEGALRLMHPFMPFITEEVWQALPTEGGALITRPWPVFEPSLAFVAQEREFTMVVEAIRAIRARRSEMNVPPSKKAHVDIETDHAAIFAQGAPFIQRLAYASGVDIGNGFNVEGAVQVITDAARIFIPLSELIDPEKEKARLEKEKAGAAKDVEALERKLGNQGFIDKAKPEVVAGEREKLAKAKERLTKIEESLKAFGG
ncbi:MAG: valine--tRNA ligase [Oscillospiraceae bacterium]|nr:valine--tRNA ligase [Oscillospiraceae bacterium]